VKSVQAACFERVANLPILGVRKALRLLGLRRVKRRVRRVLRGAFEFESVYIEEYGTDLQVCQWVCFGYSNVAGALTEGRVTGKREKDNAETRRARRFAEMWWMTRLYKLLAASTCGEVESKPSDLGNDRGYRVPTVRSRQDAMAGRCEPRPYNGRLTISVAGASETRAATLRSRGRLQTAREID
jgi:hypothetical protein